MIFYVNKICRRWPACAATNVGLVMCQESFQIQKKPEGPNGIRELASDICELLMPNETGAKPGEFQASLVEWYMQLAYRF